VWQAHTIGPKPEENSDNSYTAPKGNVRKSTNGTWSRERIYRMGGGLVIYTVIIPLALSFPIAGCSCRSWDKWLIKFSVSQSSMTHFFRVIIAWVIIKWEIITWEIIKYVMIWGIVLTWFYVENWVDGFFLFKRFVGDFSESPKTVIIWEGATRRRMC